MLRKIIYFIIVLAVIFGASGAWYVWQKPKPLSTSHAKPSPITVKLATVKSATIPMTVQAVGNVQAEKSIIITAPFAGIVQSVRYQPGAFVHVGQILIQLQQKPYQIKVHAAKAALELARFKFEAEQKLNKEGVKNVAGLATARANDQQALAALHQAQLLLSKTTIRAPFSGFVGGQSVYQGSTVREGQSLTTLTDKQTVVVNYQLSESAVPQLHLGQVVTVIVPQWRHAHFQGQVTYLAPTVSSVTHSVAVQATLQNPQLKLIPGLFVLVKQTLAQQRDALIIPRQALIPTITGSQVFVVLHHHVMAVPVTLGMNAGNNVQIISPLKLGEHVVIAGQQKLHQGSLVKALSQ